MGKTLRLILGDQLNRTHSWFQEKNDETTYVFMEVRSETDYTKHHVQKVVGIFGAMRSMADWLREEGHQVTYISLDDISNQQSLEKNIMALVKRENFAVFEYQLPDEWRVDEVLRGCCDKLDIETRHADTEHFFTDRDTLNGFFEGKKQMVMERFYRWMRKKNDVLMDGDEPESGEWNYDASNRKKLPKDVQLPKAKTFDHDLRPLVEMLKESGAETMGEIDAEHFPWPLTPKEGQELLAHFCEHLLVHFGDYQDALTTEDWSLFHARISFALNVKMISPKEVVALVENTWRDRKEEIDISQAEGFIRQIIGWREFMRGVYWWKMPEFAGLNYFNHDRPLPKWYWTGETKMKCLSHTIKQSLDHAYAHHIQRLMITGNFALLNGTAPDEVDAWYLGIYIDAFEWVEITNTRGMSQFADGGIVGTKPYVSSASYIHKMGDYCTQCHYDKSKKSGEGACPFNSLFWHFYARNEAKLKNNPRVGMMYATWAKMKEDTKEEILNTAEKYLSEVDYL